ncbi:MAG: bifunctional oligoribonuclease/PAP phosphatase NrnA [Thermoleophilia bacterium]|nr:bifunctional oligoribonuclease/PAP phosphatase NrnA [Thermoleophilia bacterium]
MTAAPDRHTLPVAEVAERLRSEKRVLAISHEAPDGDALGCLSAFGLVCDQLGIACTAWIPGESPFPPEYLFLAGLDDVARGEVPPVEPGTTVYFFDCASLLRSNSREFPTGVTRVNIDHHQDNPGYGEMNLVDPAAPSTTAILYEVLRAGGFPIDVQVATALYVGLVTDTGRFQYSNTTPGAHRMAAELQEAGVDVASIYRHVYESTPLPKLLLLERALGNLDVRLGGALVVSWLRNDDFMQAGADEGHAEGLIDTLRRIHGVRVAVLLRERARGDLVETKASLRSTDGDLDVAALAHEKGGGGHARAAGFTTAEDIPTVLAWIEQRVEASL